MEVGSKECKNLYQSGIVHHLWYSLSEQQRTNLFKTDFFFQWSLQYIQF